MNFLDYSLLQVENFTLIFGRVIGFVAVLPIFNSALLPIQLKIGLSILLTIIIASYTTVVVEVSSFWLFAIYFVTEFLIGLLISFVCFALIYSSAFAGHIIDQQNSLEQTTEFDPVLSIPSSITGQLFLIMFTVVFMYIGGHHFLIEAIAYSFDVIKVGGMNFLQESILDIIIYMLTYVFVIGFKIAAPVFTSLVVITVVLGVISKSMPQINVMVLGMPLKIAISVIFTIFSLPIIKWIFEKSWNELEILIVNLLRVLGKA